MRETLELLDDLLAEGAGAVDDNDLLELGVVAVLRSKFPDAKDIKWVGGTAPYDVQIGNEKWEVKQFKPDGTLARIGSGKSSDLDSNPASEMLTSIASAIVRNLPFLEDLAKGNPKLEEAIEWMKFKPSGAKKSRVLALSEMWIVSSTMKSIKAGDLGRHLITIHGALMNYIGLDDESDTKFDVIVRQQGTSVDANIGTVNNRQLQLKVKPAIQGAESRQSSGDKKLVEAADVFNPIDDALSEEGFIESLTGSMWVKLFKEVAGVNGFIGVDFVNITSNGPGNFNVTLDRIVMYALDDLSIDSIDTKRPVPLPINAGTNISVVPNTSITETVSGTNITVTVNSTGQVGSAIAARIFKQINSIESLLHSPLGDATADIEDILGKDSTKATDVMMAIKKVLTNPSSPFYQQFNDWVSKNEDPAKSKVSEFVLKTLKDYVRDLPALPSTASFTLPPSQDEINSGRSRPGPRLMETLSLLEDLLTP